MSQKLLLGDRLANHPILNPILSNLGISNLTISNPAINLTTKKIPPTPPPEISQNLSDWDIDFNDDWQDSDPEPEPRDFRGDSRVDPSEDFRGLPREDLKPDSRVDPRENLRSEPRTPSNPPQDSRPPSTYAYGKGDEDNSGVGKTEAVYEANYRVINAPFSPPPAVAKQQEEDWGLEDEDDSVFDFPETPETPEQGNSK
ncbi:MAG: hypothetical protein HC916_12345 [Coleofasciculaceae cyanobacterium SM2_1_6]|nr:hypothetical protein [Coleofasciculaceae cyanobacterium SM2_1_6]